MKKYLILLITIFRIYGTGIAITPNFLWAKQHGGNSIDIGKYVLADSAGNVYTTGSFEGTADFDPGPGVFNLSSVGNSDIFISKMDAGGNFLWAKQFGDPGVDIGNAIAFDNNQNILIVALRSYNTYIFKLDPSGNVLWIKNIGGDGLGIDIDSLGNIFTTGAFFVSQDFDPGPGSYIMVPDSNSVNSFVSKLDSSGNFVWAKQFEGTAFSICVDAIGKVFTAGIFNGTADFDPGPGNYILTTNGNQDVFVSSVDSGGNFMWAKSFTCTSTTMSFSECNSIALDAAGNVYTAGQFNDTVDFDPGSGTSNLVSSGSFDIFFSKLTPTGDFVWVKKIGGLNTDKCYALRTDPAGNFYMTGSFFGLVDFDPGSGHCVLTSQGLDIFALKFDSSANFVWGEKMGGTDSDAGYSIGAGLNGSTYVTGYFGGTGDFDPGPDTTNLTSSGLEDVFVVKLTDQCIPTNSSISPVACFSFISPSGSYIWTVTGNYIDTITNANGCDSIISISLTVNTVDTSVTQNGIMLQANAIGSSFQWLDCDNGNAILPGDTNFLFTAIADGNYAVAVTQNGCIDTSFCYSVTGITGISKFTNYGDVLCTFPNPAGRQLEINCDHNGIKTIEIYNTIGEKMISFQNSNDHLKSNETSIDISGLFTAIYIVKVTTEKGIFIRKLVVQ